MSDFDVTILGCGSATPSLRHLPACQAIEYRGRVMLIDCGEGAQLSMRRAQLKFSRLTDIFISHLHGDHFLGLPGLLSTLSLHDIGGEITIHSFAQGIELLKHILSVVAHPSSFQIKYNELDPRGGQTILETAALKVSTFALYHRGVPCVGFRFDEKPKPRHINGEMVRYHQVPTYQIESLRYGADYIKPDGTVIPNEMLTSDPDPATSYAYASDTTFDKRVARAVAGVDTLYHEATYGEDRKANATQNGHTTAAQAAEIARLAGAKRLIIGHFSKAYDDLTPLLQQAQAVFPNTILADEGMKINLL